MAKYRNSHLTNSMLPTLEQIKQYVRKATSDDLNNRDIRQLMSFLQRLPQVDRYLLGLIQTRKVALLGFPYTIKFPDEINPGDKEKKYLVEIKERFVKSKMHKVFNTLMNGILYGQSAVRLTWQPKTDFGTMVVAKRNLELTELDFNLEDSMKLDFIETQKGMTYQRSELDPETHIYMRFNPLEGIENDYPGSYMRSNMIYIWLKYTDFFNWSSANEKFGDPLRVALYDKQRTTPEDIAAIKQGLDDLGTDASAAFSKDVEIKFIEALRSGITDMHDRFIEAVNKETAISILGQTLTTDISKIGSFAAAKVHNFVRQDILWSDIIEFQNVLTTQYVQKDFQLNYGEPINGYPVFEFLTDDIQDYEANARTFSELKISFPQMQFIKDEVYERTGWTKPDESIEPENLI